MDPEKLPAHVAEKIMETMLKSGVLSFLQIDGTSMEPFLKNKTRVLVDHRIRDFSVGLVVLFENSSGETFLHRIVLIEDGKIVTKGDSRLDADPPIESASVRGVVTAFQDEGGKITYINREPYISFGRMTAQLSLKNATAFHQLMEESTGNESEAKSLHAEAYGLYREGNKQEALDVFRKALAHNPGSLLSRVDAGEILRQMGRYREAIFHLRAAIELDGHRTDISAQACNIAGNTFSDMGLFEESIEEYNSCLSISPDFAPAYVNRGWAFYRLGLGDMAERDFEEVLKLQPRNFKALKCLGLLFLTSGRYDKAVETLTEARTLDPKDPDILNNLGLAYMKTGPLKKAGDFFRMAIVASPGHFDTLFNLGRFIERTSSSADALVHYMKMRDKFPDNMELRGEIARLGALG